jgi:hypothetical protein
MLPATFPIVKSISPPITYADWRSPGRADDMVVLAVNLGDVAATLFEEADRGMFWKNDHAAEPANTPVPWGDGLIDVSLSDLWYAADWNSVSDDELVFLLPSLNGWRAIAGDAVAARDSGPIPYLTRTLQARAVAGASLIARRSHQSVAEALDHLVAVGIVTKIQPSAGDIRNPDYEISLPGERRAADGPWLRDELRAVAYLDRILHDALGSSDNDESTRAPVFGRPRSLDEAIAMSVHSRLNAAYVYPEYTFAHELLTVAGVLGHLSQGRPAYISPPIARCIADVMATRISKGADGAVTILRKFAESVGGVDYIVKAAARAKRGTILLRPRLVPIPIGAGRLPLNRDFLQQVRNEL